ncbi:MAG TPA: hypothetical protein VF260_13010 [Bacilli bacterium]
MAEGAGDDELLALSEGWFVVFAEVLEFPASLPDEQALSKSALNMNKTERPMINDFFK